MKEQSRAVSHINLSHEGQQSCSNLCYIEIEIHIHKFIYTNTHILSNRKHFLRIVLSSHCIEGFQELSALRLRFYFPFSFLL